jgi:integrase
MRLAVCCARKVIKSRDLLSMSVDFDQSCIIPEFGWQGNATQFVCQFNEFLARWIARKLLNEFSSVRSICNEAMEQEYLTKDPTRKLRTPKNIRETDKTVLSWDELRRVFNASSQRDRLIISIEGIAGLRPSELFALRRQSFDGHRLTIAETIYRGKLRDYGKTKGSLTTVELPEELANPVGAWLEALADKSPAAFLFPNSDGGFILKDNYLHRVLYPLGKQLGLAKLKRAEDGG